MAPRHHHNGAFRWRARSSRPRREPSDLSLPCKLVRVLVDAVLKCITKYTVQYSMGQRRARRLLLGNGKDTKGSRGGVFLAPNWDLRADTRDCLVVTLSERKGHVLFQSNSWNAGSAQGVLYFVSNSKLFSVVVVAKPKESLGKGILQVQLYLESGIRVLWDKMFAKLRTSQQKGYWSAMACIVQSSSVAR